MFNFIKKDDLKSSVKLIVAVIAVLLLYNLIVYKFVFLDTFGRNDKPFKEKKQIEFFGGEQNYSTYLQAESWFNEQEFSELTLNSFDGLKLSALLLEAQKDCRGTIILMHGYHSLPERDFATLARFYHSLNYNVLLPYERAHGKSEGKFITFGIKERYDCRDWILKINELYGDDMNIFVQGISMGCATVLMASSFEMPLNVRGIIADCGFTSPSEILYWTMVKQTKIPRLIARFIMMTNNFFAEHVASFSFDEYSTYTALAKANVPILFISGDKDETVPVDMTMNNFLQYKMKNDEKAELLIIEGAPHAVSNIINPEKYLSKVEEFLLKYELK